MVGATTVAERLTRCGRGRVDIGGCIDFAILSPIRQCQRKLHACHEQAFTRLPLELLNGLPQVPAHELRVPIDPVQGARHDVLLCRVDRPREVPSNQASLPSALAAATLPPSSSKSPGQRGGHRPGRGSR